MTNKFINSQHDLESIFIYTLIVCSPSVIQRVPEFLRFFFLFLFFFGVVWNSIKQFFHFLFAHGVFFIVNSAV